MRVTNKTAFTGLGLVAAVLITAVLSPIGNRIGWWGYGGAVEVLTWAGYGGMLASGVCLLGLLRALRGAGGLLASLAGLLIMLSLLTFLQFWYTAKNTLPPIHDISTDVVDAPDFWAAPNANLYGGAKEAAMQQQAYPDIQPLILPVPTAQAFALAQQVIDHTGWKVFDSDPENGRIEATEKTFWFGYSDDIVIRISPLSKAAGSRIDIRSSSRFGSGTDGGTNARRVRKLLQAIQSKYSSD